MRDTPRKMKPSVWGLASGIILKGQSARRHLRRSDHRLLACRRQGGGASEVGQATERATVAGQPTAARRLEASPQRDVMAERGRMLDA
jgi:hypothetical protein